MKYNKLLTLVITAANIVDLTYQSTPDKHDWMPGVQFYDGKKLNIPISTESGEHLLAGWINQGISSLISAIAQQQMGRLNEYHRNRLFKCSRNAEQISDQAGCVIDAIDSKPSTLSDKKIAMRLDKFNSLFDRRSRLVVKPSRLPQWSPDSDMGYRKKIIYRSRRDAIRRHNYKLRTEYDNITPFGVIGKYLARAANSIKQKKHYTPWRTQLQQIEAIRERHNVVKKFVELLRKRFSPSKKLKTDANFSNRAWKATEPTKNDWPQLLRLLNGALNLTLTLNGVNTTMFKKNSTLKLASPRFFSIGTESVAENEIRMLSPSLFSLHDKGSGFEALTSVPNLLKSSGSGSSTDDYNEWLNFIFEASGVNDAIQTFKKNGMEAASAGSSPNGVDNQPLYFTIDNLTSIDPEQARKAQLFERVTRKLTTKQLSDFNTSGFSLLSTEQLMMVYGPESPFNDSRRLNYFKTLNEVDLRAHLVNVIRLLAKSRNSNAAKSRQKRDGVVLSPIFNDALINDAEQASKPLILSPALINLILFSPSIFGAVILSPWLFVAMILSPRMMAPLVLAPSALSAIILSPLVMNPLILSPGALIPYVLSPRLLGPFILSPAVLCPNILSPFALSPAILSATMATATVLSPFAFSPLIWSPQYLTLFLLSPHAFSPLINSTSERVWSIFSPSIFS